MARGTDGRLRAEAVPTASCPVTDARVRVDPSWRPGEVVRAPCGHAHVATLEFGAWALEEVP